MHYVILVCYFLVVSVNFGQSTYSANENTTNVEVNLQLSNPSSTEIIVQVTNRDISANSRGTYLHIL